MRQQLHVLLWRARREFERLRWRIAEIKDRRKRLVIILMTVLGANLIWIGTVTLLVYPYSLATSILPSQERVSVEALRNRALAVAVYDSTGRFGGFFHRVHEVGVIPGQFEPRPGRNIEVVADHKTIAVAEPPRWYLSCLFELEDRHSGTWRNPFGIDFLSTVRIPYSVVLGGSRRGGSTIEMQLARAIRQDFAHAGEPVSETLMRKANEWRYAPIIHGLARSQEGGDGLDRWASMHLPHIQMTGGYVVYGVEAASLTLFGRPATQLTPAEQFVLAASVQQNYALSVDPEHRAYDRMYAAWRRQLVGSRDKMGRAELCAHRLLPEESRDAALTQLRDLADAPPQVFVDSALQALLDETGTPASRIASPELRLSRLGGDLASGLLAQARDMAGPEYNREIAELHLTVDLVANHRFTRTIRAELSELFEDLAAAGSLADDPERRTTVAAIADEDGRILRYYSEGYDSPFFGHLHNREAHYDLGANLYRGAYRPEQETREIASTSKILAAIALSGVQGERGVTGYDNTCVGGSRIRCYCESGCSDRRDRVQARHVMGESLNDALINRLAGTISDARLRALAAQARLTLPEHHADTPAQSLVTYGRYAATPRRVQQLAMAALRRARGETGPTSALTLVETVVMRGEHDAPGEAAAASGPGSEPITFDTPATPEGAAYLSEVLSAPICYSGGTLHGLRAWCPSAGRVAAHIAKSGTRGTGAGGLDVYDWWITGAVETLSGRRYSYILATGQGNPSEPFTDRSSSAATPVAAALLREIETIDRIVSIE